jgi:hypothetical protein
VDSSVVSLSEAGKAAASKDAGTTPAGSDASAHADQPSGAKAFAYGVVGLGAPKSESEQKAESEKQAQTDTYYTAGRVLTAAVAIGALLSVIV